jgi:hypothetical protein
MKSSHTFPVDLSKYSASHLGANALRSPTGLSSEENSITFQNAWTGFQAVADVVFLCLIPAIRVAQHIAYALDTSRASSSSNRILSGAYD